MLTISVKNFGPIAEGSVDLKPLTIFVGPSNTGKSYMATAVYAVMRAAPLTENWVRLANDKTYQMSEGLLTRLSDWARQDLGSHLTSVVTVSNLPSIIQKWVNDATLGHLEHYRSDVEDEIQKFRGGTSSLVRQGQTTSACQLTIRKDIPILSLEIYFANGVRSSPTFDISRSELPEYMLGNIPNVLLNTKNDRIRAETVGGWIHSIAAGLFDRFPGRVFYLPAGRSAITQARRAMSAEIILQHWKSGTRSETAAPLPRPLTVFLSDLIVINKHGYDEREYGGFQQALNFIESEVLSGKVEINELNGLPFPDISYETPAGKFTLDQTSSMVTELAPLVLFLKYLVRPGDLLILEEPESHLHPAAQLQLARGVARLVNAGVQVLITTHSNDFTGQINNLISMSNVSEETWKSLGLEPEECLQPEQVSAYGFRIDRDKGGAVTYPLPVGSDVGIEDEEFLPVIELLYEQAIQMQRNRLS